MGAVCAVVYLLALICFIPFPFYKDIVAATSGGGNKDKVLQVMHVETGRFLHRFPHNKVGLENLLLLLDRKIDTLNTACILPRSHTLTAIGSYTGYRR